MLFNIQYTLLWKPTVFIYLSICVCLYPSDFVVEILSGSLALSFILACWYVYESHLTHWFKVKYLWNIHCTCKISHIELQKLLCDYGQFITQHKKKSNDKSVFQLRTFHFYESACQSTANEYILVIQYSRACLSNRN